MGKKISDLSDDELASMDLDELLLMSKEMKDSKKDNVSKTTETLKKAGSKTFDVSKKVATEVTDIAKQEYRNYKKQRDYNKENGIDNLDDKVKRILRGYTLTAYVAKKKLNDLIKKQLDEEKGITIGYYIKEFLKAFLGKWIYLACLGSGILVFVLLIQIFRTAVIFLPVFYFLYKYIKTMLKYSDNSKIFGFNWYIYVLNNYDGYHKATALETYFDTAKNVMDDRTALEIYFEERGVASVKNTDKKKKEYAKVDEIKVDFDEHYNLTLNSKITNYHLRKTVKEEGLTAVEINDLFMIAQRNNGSELTDDVYYQVHNVVKQSVDALLGKISREGFLEQVITDERINYAFPEISNQLEEEEKERLAKEEEQKLYEAFEEKGLNDKAIKIVTKLKKNQEDWGISVRDLFGRSLKFSPDYLKVRADLMDNTTRQDVQKNVNRIAQKVGILPKVQQAENESAVYLLFRLKDRIKSKKLSWNQIVSDANKGIVNIGAGTLGDVKVYYPRLDEPFFSLIGGISRSGKSTFATRFISGALMLNDGNGHFDYEDVFIGSMKAVDDYIPLGWDKKGMVLLDDPQKIYNMLQKIDEIAQQRVRTFQDAGVVNIKQYNKKYPDKKMGKILLIMDEYKNTMTSAESFKVETEGGKKKLSEAIEDLLVKINSLHGSRGVNTIVITQSFAKNGVGRVRDTLGSQFLGYADKDVWNSIDKHGEMSGYMSNKEESRQGLFFMKAPDFKLAEGVETEKFDSGFVEISTHFTETEVIRDNFKRQFDTADKYLSSILNNSTSDDSVESSIEEMESIDLFD